MLDVGKWEERAMELSSVFTLLGDLATLVNNPDAFPDVTFLLEGQHKVVAHKVRIQAE